MAPTRSSTDTAPVVSGAPDLNLLPAPPATAGGLLCVAYSGGLDSTVLLHHLAAAYPGRVRAVHIHHGLQASADSWALHCQDVCAAFGVPFEARQVLVQPQHPQGPEAAAREARYAALSAALTAGETLVTAHHRDDQAETFLLRALRGAGAAGLSGMASWQRFGPGGLWRPLLDTPRAQLAAYAAHHALRWVDDPHNTDTRYTRSALRQSLMPALEELRPGAAAALARSAGWCREALELLDERAAEDAQELMRGEALDLPGLMQLSDPRRKNLLRWWLRQLGLPPPRQTVLERLAAELAAAAPDATPLLQWPGGELRRYRDRLYAMPPLQPVPENWQMAWNGEPLELPAGAGRMWCEALPEPVLLRFARSAEHFRPAGSAHRRLLKTLFQEHAVPPWQRTRTPVAEWQGEAVWIGGIGAAHGAPEWVVGLRRG